MTGKKQEDLLDAVYQARTPEQVAELYDTWAGSYDAEMARAGYRHPAICLALLARHLPRGASPLLDAGAGTGQAGEWAALIGYPDIEALDISAGMLAVAKQKHVYSAFHQLALGSGLPFADSTFAGILSTGVFTTGHVGAEALDELIRICRPGGVFVLTIKETMWQGDFGHAVSALIDAGSITLADQTEPYISMPGEAQASPSRAVVLKKIE